MKNKLIIFLLLFIGFQLSAIAVDTKITSTDYIDMWKDEAMFQMIEHNIPASITLAQGMLESGFGNSTLATKANNHFGIKCHNWKGKKVYHDDDKKNECFRKYKNAGDSFEDHSIFLKQPRYKFLYDYKITNYKAWAKGLKKAGYATDPKYPKRLIKLIEDNNLDQYDREALKMAKKGKKPKRKPKENPSKPKGKRPVKGGVNTEEELPVIALGNTRKVDLSSNKIKFVEAKKNDTFESIAEDLDLMPWQIKKYNDFEKNHSIKTGEIVYLQPKRNNGSKKWHTMKSCETLWDISQQYGIKMKALYKKNGIAEGTSPKAGTKISLKKNVTK